MDGTAKQNLDEMARSILHGNDRGTYTIPTAGLYPYQWNWDSAFAAFGFAQFDLDRAWVELETLLASQWNNGMVPHIIFHKQDPGYFPGPDVWGCPGPVPSSGISQPPIAATMARFIFDKDPSVGAARMAPLFDKLMAWHAWFMAWRNDGGAIFITHPWEAGRDNCPDWDEAMAAIDPVGVGDYTRRDTSHVDPAMRPTKDDYDRYIWLVMRGVAAGWDDLKMSKDAPFRVADPTMTFTLLRACRDLIYLGDKLGKDTGQVTDWIAQLEIGAERLINPETGMYDAINLTTGHHTGNLSNASYLCWYAGIDSAPMLAALDQCYATCDFPIASHDVSAPDFDGMRYWRGPTWPIMNTLIGIGLADMGYKGHAEHLQAATRRLLEEEGFSEYFHPIKGTPAGGSSFTWTAAIWLGWASPNAEKI